MVLLKELKNVMVRIPIFALCQVLPATVVAPVFPRRVVGMEPLMEVISVMWAPEEILPAWKQEMLNAWLVQSLREIIEPFVI